EERTRRCAGHRGPCAPRAFRGARATWTSHSRRSRSGLAALTALVSPSRAGHLSVVSAFSHPDFTTPQFAHAPDARFVPAPADGVLPEGFFSTTNLPTYVRVGGVWRMPREPRMDSALVIDESGELWVREGRRVKAGELVAVG